MDLYSIQFTRSAQREFLALPKTAQQRIQKKVEFFVNSGTPLAFAKALRGTVNRYRFRVGDYRVLFAIKDDKVLTILLILKVAHRRDVYE